ERDWSRYHFEHAAVAFAVANCDAVFEGELWMAAEELLNNFVLPSGYVANDGASKLAVFSFVERANTFIKAVLLGECFSNFLLRTADGECVVPLSLKSVEETVGIVVYLMATTRYNSLGGLLVQVSLQ